ncbi:MAG: hypothetical protein VYB48_01300 [Pseudomonadota bacterium]|nr:hypothetical protein [Pseudomonadota bacterium]
MQSSQIMRWRAPVSLALILTLSAFMVGCGADDASSENEEAVENTGDILVNESPDQESDPEPSKDTGNDSESEADSAADSEDTEAVNPVFSTALPDVNSNLTTDSPVGIWMLVAEESSAAPNAEDSMNPFLFEKTNREFVAVTENAEGIYVLTRCDGSWRDVYELTATEAGYDATYSETTGPDEGGVEYTTTTQFSVVYGADNQTLTVSGTKTTQPAGEDLTLTVEGVKVSNAPDFYSADEFTAFTQLDYVNLGNGDAEPEGAPRTRADLPVHCVGSSVGQKTTESATDEWQLDQRYFTVILSTPEGDPSDQIQYYELNQNTDGEFTRSLGAVIDVSSTESEQGVVTMYLHACSVGADEEAACEAAAEWTETSSASADGITFDINFEVVNNDYVVNPLALTPFTAFLWPHDGDFMRTQLSVTLSTE